MYAIVGAGIGGLTTALTFEKLGIEYRIFEKAKAFLEVGAGILLAPNALQILDWLGLLENVQQAGHNIDRISLTKPNLSSIFDDCQDHLKQKFGYYSVAIHRAALQKLLLDQIPKEKIHTNASFKHYEFIDKKIKLIFDNNTSFVCDYLIGADGIKSKIRTQLFPNSKIRYSGQTCWRGISNLQLAEDFENRGVEIWGQSIRFGLTKVSKQQTYWFAVALSPANQKNEKEIKQVLLNKYKLYHPLVQKLISSTEEDTIIRSDINDIKPLKYWSKHHICLIGDAAHATTPNMGQGGAQAIEDAYYLAHSIIKNRKEAFKNFEAQRKTKVDFIVNRSRLIGNVAHYKYMNGLRDFVLTNIPKSLMRKDFMKIYNINMIS